MSLVSFASFVKHEYLSLFFLVILLTLLSEAKNSLTIRDCIDLLFYICLKEGEKWNLKKLVVAYYFISPFLYALYVQLPIISLLG